MVAAIKPLRHIKVLDLSRVMAGPWATQNLADLGATVIKVEKPGHGDDTRGWGPPFVGNDDEHIAAYFLAANRGKQSIAIDITTDKGQELIKQLAKECDIFIENFKVGAMKNFGLDYDALKAINPQLIYCSISGFGQDGPYADKPGYDYMMQAMGGLMSITGDNEPMRVGVPITDIMTGMYATIAIHAALLEREQSGNGTYIDMALFDVQLAMLANQAQNYLASGNVPGRIGNTHPNIVPYQLFRATDDYLIIAVGNDKQFATFCNLLDLSDLATDERFATNAARVRNRDELIPQIAAVIQTKSAEEWLEILEQANIPCGPVNHLDQAFDHPQAQHRETKQTLPHPTLGDITTVQNPIRFANSSLQNDLPPPMLGEHTEQVLKNELGLSDDEIKTLKSGGVIA